MAMATDVVRQPVVKLLLSSGERLGGSSGHRDDAIQSIHLYLFNRDLARPQGLGACAQIQFTLEAVPFRPEYGVQRPC